ncbi:hypothetical protein [Nocardia jiangsuensis]|uniref:RDD family protein n=1 Tax=Nocardia jiangsuensis TaxID=1691563 RepID=A0ABV8DN14_9NOCA
MEHAAIVTPGRRIAAWSLDFGVVVLLTAALGWLTRYRIGDYLSDWPPLGAGSAWELMGSAGDVAAAEVEIGSGVVGELMSLVRNAPSR